MTSHDVVSFVRKEINVKKAGHTGTLDPNAAGVLPICVGQGTKISQYLLDGKKVSDRINSVLKRIRKIYTGRL